MGHKRKDTVKVEAVEAVEDTSKSKDVTNDGPTAQQLQKKKVKAPALSNEQLRNALQIEMQKVNSLKISLITLADIINDQALGSLNDGKMVKDLISKIDTNPTLMITRNAASRPS
jgi:hypothetical protein